MVLSGWKTIEAPQLQYVARWSMPLLRMSGAHGSDDFRIVSVFSAELGSSADTGTASVFGAFEYAHIFCT